MYKKDKFLCRNGPWAGHMLFLTEWHGVTAPLTINGVAGRYVGGWWVEQDSALEADTRAGPPADATPF